MWESQYQELEWLDSPKASQFFKHRNSCVSLCAFACCLSHFHIKVFFFFLNASHCYYFFFFFFGRGAVSVNDSLLKYCF